MNYDVIVVGTGPAGLSASIELTKRDINHVLIDPRPTDQIEHANGVFNEAVEEFGLSGMPIRGSAWIVKDRRFEIWGKMPESAIKIPIAYIVDEKEMRETLLKRCDADIIPELVLDAHRIQNGIEVLTEDKNISAPLVIDCSGSGAIIASKLYYNWTLACRYLEQGLKFDVPMEDFSYDEETVVVGLEHHRGQYPSEWGAPCLTAGNDHTTMFFPGFVFNDVFLTDNINTKDRGKELVRTLTYGPMIDIFKRYFPEIADNALKNVVADEEYWGVVRWSLVNRPYSNNLLLAGDSAGQAMTLTGAGVWPALEHGKWAGITASDAVCANDFSEYQLSEYQWFIDQSPYFDRNWTRFPAWMCHHWGTWVLEMLARQTGFNMISEGFDINELLKITNEYKNVKFPMPVNFILTGVPALSSQILIEGLRILRGRKWQRPLKDMLPIINVESDGGLKVYGAELRRLILK